VLPVLLFLFVVVVVCRLWYHLQPVAAASWWICREKQLVTAVRFTEELIELHFLSKIKRAVYIFAVMIVIAITWPVPSKLPANLHQERPLASSWPPRLLARVPQPPEA